MNLVTGATGVLGGEICRLLREKGLPARALVRKTSDETRRNSLEALQVSICEGDLKDRDSLRGACSGARTIISTATTIVSKQPSDSFDATDRDGHLQLIDEAEKAGVSKFIFVSFPPFPFEFPLQSAKRAVEDRLKKSKLTFTILQPALFQEVWLGPHLGFDANQGSARIYGSGKNKISWISFRDVAKFAVAAVTEPFLEKRTLQLGGPEALSPLEVINIFEKAQNRKWNLEFVPEEALLEQYKKATDATQKTFTALMLSYARGLEVPMNSLLEEIPMQLQSISQYAKGVSQR